VLAAFRIIAVVDEFRDMHTMSGDGEVRYLGGTVAEQKGHVCAFFNSVEEEFEVLVPLIKHGVNRGDRFWYMVDPVQRAELVQRLRREDVDADALLESGQLGLYPWEEAHLRGGSFDKEAILRLADETLTSHEKQGFPFTRMWSNQGWALKDVSKLADLIEYESRFNAVAERHPSLTVCVYDLSQFGASIVMDMLHTHPLVILGGTVHDNPFYIPPDQFLRDLGVRSTPPRLDVAE
jgi:hypothetical protein